MGSPWRSERCRTRPPPRTRARSEPRLHREAYARTLDQCSENGVVGSSRPVHPEPRLSERDTEPERAETPTLAYAAPRVDTEARRVKGRVRTGNFEARPGRQGKARERSDAEM